MADFLKSCNIPNLDLFERQQVDGEDLLSMTEDELAAEPFALPPFKIKKLMKKLEQFR